MKFMLSVFIGYILFTMSYFVYSGIALIKKANEYSVYLDQRIDDTREFIKFLKEEEEMRMGIFIANMESKGIPMKSFFGIEEKIEK